ncbi:GspH/FimT family pseudopilin [Litorivivens sp.]|uniref:GspH/FimT family pseudopilin n=1 Tax=Litorivivens sp. TaxID=2020868 RepID=UPI0035621771
MLEVKRSLRGYTLMELLVTLSIVAIIASIAVPSFQNMIATQRVRSATADLTSALSLARSEAVKRNRVVTITPAGSPAAWHKGWSISYVDANGNTQTLETHGAIDGVTMAGSTALSFRSDGRRNSAAVAITISPPSGSSAKKHCVEVSPTGKTETKAGAC